MRFLKLAAPVFLPLALAACMTPATDAPSLDGTHWRFTSIDGAEPAAFTTSLQFADRLNANAGCNGMSGPWRMEAGRLVVGPLISTRKFCEGLMQQEAAVSALLSGSPAVNLSGDTLTLTSSGHSAELARMP
jgi:heat shock protein HslJ